MKNQLITEKEYEVYFSEIHILPADDFGPKRLNFYVRIRKDVKQKFRNRVVFKTLNLESVRGKNNKGPYKTLKRILRRIGREINFDAEDDIQKFIDAVINKPFKVRIVKRLKYNQPKLENTIYFDEIDRTEYPDFTPNK